jgi:hypothetical protein
MKKLSSRARALTEPLLARLRHGPVPTSALESWWEQRSGVLRVELFRLLRRLTEEGKVERSGDLYALPGALPTAPPDGHARLVLGTGDPSTAVVLTGPREKVGAIVKGYQRQTVTGTKDHTATVAVHGATVVVTASTKERADQVARACERGVSQADDHRILDVLQATTDKLKGDRRMSPAEKVIHAALRRKPLTSAEVVAKVPLPATTVRGRLSDMAKRGLVKRREDGRYEVAL